MSVKSTLYIGLMTGTSVDSIDAALIDFSDDSVKLLHSHCETIPTTLKKQIRSLFIPGSNEIDALGKVDLELAQLFANAVDTLLKAASLSPKQIRAIGSHGQTIRHRPPENNSSQGFTLQIGDANTLAALTGIDVIADFRRRDMALGGQGAPLAPAFHQSAFLLENKTRYIINIGGIANITALLSDGTVLGLDSGPGNGLMDAWIQKHKGLEFDRDGEWAASGKVEPKLLNALLQHPYFSLPTPKSTGKEVFHLEWLHSAIEENGEVFSAENIQATLLELTLQSISKAIEMVSSLNKIEAAEGIYLCGGGAKNSLLIRKLEKHFSNTQLQDTAALGIDPDWVEAACFAWLAKQFIEGLPGNLPSVTGASKPSVLGALYPAGS